jgi:hypothetical protein
MKILALDMDGVVNSNKLINAWLQQETDYIKLINPELSDEKVHETVIKRFKDFFNDSKELIFTELALKVTKICEETDACILWTSSWRLENEYKDIEVAKEMFNRHYLPGDRLIGYTPSLHNFYGSNLRGDEIRVWLESNIYGKIKKCAVIDDLIYAGFNLPENAKFFQTNYEDGITDKLVNKICRYLND